MTTTLDPGREGSAATVSRVAPNPKRELSDGDRLRILDAKARQEAAYANYQRAVIEGLANGAGVRAVAELTGLSTTTIMRWKRDAEN